MSDENPLIAEVRKARREILEAHNGDCLAMMRAMMRKQGERKRVVVKPSPKPSARPGERPSAYLP